MVDVGLTALVGIGEKKAAGAQVKVKEFELRETLILPRTSWADPNGRLQRDWGMMWGAQLCEAGSRVSALWRHYVVFGIYVLIRLS